VSRTRRAMTVTELIVAFILLGLLAALAGFGVTQIAERSRAETASTALVVVFDAQVQFAGIYGTYTPSAGDLELPSTEITVVDRPSLGPSEVSIAVGTDGTLALALENVDGGCVGILASSLGAGATRVPATFTSGSLCDARAILPAGEPPLPASSVAW
jgi:type II secretory pathway pseudopilin PulG